MKPGLSYYVGFCIVGHRAWLQDTHARGFALFTAARAFIAHTYSFQTTV